MNTPSSHFKLFTINDANATHGCCKTGFCVCQIYPNCHRSFINFLKFKICLLIVKRFSSSAEMTAQFSVILKNVYCFAGCWCQTVSLCIHNLHLTMFKNYSFTPFTKYGADKGEDGCVEEQSTFIQFSNLVIHCTNCTLLEINAVVVVSLHGNKGIIACF